MSSSSNSYLQTGLLISADIETLRQPLHMTRIEVVTYMILTSDLFFEEFIVYKEVLANSS